MMKRLLVLLGGGLIAAAQSLTLQVQVHYTGSGRVDATHRVFVALWDTDRMGGGPPVDVQSTASKDGTVTFSNVKKVPAYISAAYDPAGKWDATGPPPSGASVGMYSKSPPTPDPITIAPGKTAKITITFDDTSKAP